MSSTTTYLSSFETEFGPFAVAVNEAGAIVATAFGKVDELKSRFAAASCVVDAGRTAEARLQIAEYLAGDRAEFDLQLAPEGSAFQKRVWRALREIPRGQTRSYGAIARELQSSGRAVGRANATNPICLIVPCHRVIGADGSLTGFAFGEEIKRRLLALEGVPEFQAAQPVLPLTSGTL
jgi:methylated-DNA-[protein]-cysteine S-methyltransferase